MCSKCSYCPQRLPAKTGDTVNFAKLNGHAFRPLDAAKRAVADLESNWRSMDAEEIADAEAEVEDLCRPRRAPRRSHWDVQQVTKASGEILHSQRLHATADRAERFACDVEDALADSRFEIRLVPVVG